MTLGRAQQRGDEAPLAVEHDHGLKAVLVVIGVEQAQLLRAMDRIEGVIDVEHDTLRHLPERGAIEIDHGTAHAQQRAGVGQVLQARDGGLGAQVASGRQAVQRHLEHRIGAQAGGVVAVLVARGDGQQAKADDVGEGV